MSISLDDLRDFQRFADERVRDGAVKSLVELAGQWEAERREMEATMADIRESHADIEAGRVSDVADAFDDVHAAIREGLRDIESGNYRPAAEVFAELRVKYGI